MSTRRKPTPSYLLHKQSGRARAVWTDQSGSRKQKLLPGAFDSRQSRIAFGRLQLELESVTTATVIGTNDISVNEVLLAYLEHADRHYRGTDGNSTDETRHLKTVCRHVRELYGAIHLPLPLDLWH